jgi:hypothetical protein
MIFLFSSLEQKTKGAAGGEGQQGERPAECKQQWGATLHILQTMVLEVWFCLMQCHWVGFVEPMGGVRWLWNLWGNFSGTWCHMLVVLSLAVLGFRYYVLCLCFEWSLLPVWYLIAHTSGIACCTFMKRVAEKFCSREKASIFAWLLNCILRIILQFGGCVLMLLYIFGVECCCPCFKNQNCYLAARLAERYIL